MCKAPNGKFCVEELSALEKTPQSVLAERLWRKGSGSALFATDKNSIEAHAVQTGTDPVHALVEVQVVGHGSKKNTFTHAAKVRSSSGVWHHWYRETIELFRELGGCGVSKFDLPIQNPLKEPLSNILPVFLPDKSELVDWMTNVAEFDKNRRRDDFPRHV